MDWTAKCSVRHTGLWSVYAPWMMDTVRQVEAGVLVPREPKAGEFRQSVDGDGILSIGVAGPMLKGDSKFEDNINTVRLRGLFRAAASDPSVKGMFLVMDSPGGSVSGTDELSRDMAAFAAVKPLHVLADDLLASAGYYAAAGATYISATPSSLVGSLGTLLVLVDQSERAAKLGVKVHVVSTGPFKGAGADGAPLTPEQLDYFQGIVDAFGKQFMEAVSKGRGISMSRTKEMFSGKVFPADDAKSLGLVDAVESYDAAYARLQRAIRRPKREARAQAMLKIVS